MAVAVASSSVGAFAEQCVWLRAPLEQQQGDSGTLTAEVPLSFLRQAVVVVVVPFYIVGASAGQSFVL